ncbi:replication protein A 70 kDa DNA-binding subunit B [Tanacetum coccineum]
MNQEITPLSDIDLMMDEVKVLVRCISKWFNHPRGKPNIKWSLEMVLQEQLGNRIQSSVMEDCMKKFEPIIDEGTCYRITNFRVRKNGGNYPLVNHKYRINFYMNTIVTRVNKFDNNVYGLRFEPFQNFSTKHFSPSDFVDVIGTVVSISDLIPFSGGLGQEKKRRTILLQDKQEILVYAKIHKIHREFGWSFLACKQCGRSAKESDDDGSSYGKAATKFKKTEKTYACKFHKGIAVVPKYKVIIRVIDESGSTCFLLYDDMIMKFIDVPCYKMIEKSKDTTDCSFPDELKVVIGKTMLFRITYSEWNIKHNNHVYQVKMLTEDPGMIETFKKDFYVEENKSDFQTPVINDGRSGYHQKDRKPSQNDKTEHGMEKTVQNQGQSPKIPKSESILKNQQSNRSRN